jgi:hypothetical protein
MEFITLDMLLSLAGCVAIVAIVTEALKRYFTKINALWLNFVCSIIIGVIRIYFLHDFTATGIVTGILNIFVIMLAAGGGYDTVKAVVKGGE